MTRARTVLLLLLFLVADSQAQLLLGYTWSTPDELRRIADAATRVRYVTAHRVLANGDRATVDRLVALGHTPFLTDEAAADESYYLEPACHHADDEAAIETAPIYRDEAGWSLYRLRADDPAQALPHFRYPLPERFDPRGWLEPPRLAKPAANASVPFVEQVLAQVSLPRIQRDLRALCLRDPAAPSAYENLRTRFTVRPETYAATEYIRDELAAVLGDTAVSIREFAVDPDRLSAHLRDQGGELPATPRGHNVVAVLPGTDPRAGYYVICGHYDATGVRTSGWNWRTDPAPGADDNATGAALILESARILSGHRFPWSIRFIAFSGEELGLLGSRAYAEVAADSGQAVLGVLNFDMFGCNALVDRVELATNPASRWLADLMVEASARYGLGLRVDVLEDDAARLSDHASFWAHGYDAVLAIENYLPTDASHYAVREGLYRLNNQYHTVRDVPDSILWPLVHKTVRLAVATLVQYAEEDGLPNLAVHPGDLTSRTTGRLGLRVTNTGTGTASTPFRVRLSRGSPAPANADSTAWESIYETEVAAGLRPGDGRELAVPWELLGDFSFLLEVDPEGLVAESREDDNRALQRLLVQPLDRIVVFPNPFRPGVDPFVSFSGLPLQARVHLYSVDGEPVWTGAEERQGTLSHEVRWTGANELGYTAASGVYLYTITTADGALLARDRLALVR